jgi:uncharacterized membrane protein YeaQ/YmgE (transglycosylase-associated protein family)
MGLLTWIVFGAIVGWLASSVMRSGGGLGWDVIMGIIGAVAGGYVMSILGQPGVSGFNLYSIVIAVLGACLVIFIARMFRRSY